MANRSRPHNAKPGMVMIKVVCFLGTQVSGFMFSPPRTALVWSSMDHVKNVHEARETAALPRLMPSPSRTCYNAIASSQATEDLTSEEVEVSMWDHLAIVELTI